MRRRGLGSRPDQSHDPQPDRSLRTNGRGSRVAPRLDVAARRALPAKTSTTGMIKTQETDMTRFADFVPHGVIPAVLLPFHDDFSIDEKSFRSHLRDIAGV